MNLLTIKGFKEVRQAGSHRYFYKCDDLTGQTLHACVPLHNKDMRQGTVYGILEDANITKQEARDFMKNPKKFAKENK